MNITVKKLAELHKPAHNIRRTPTSKSPSTSAALKCSDR